MYKVINAELSAKIQELKAANSSISKENNKLKAALLESNEKFNNMRKFVVDIITKNSENNKNLYQYLISGVMPAVVANSRSNGNSRSSMLSTSVISREQSINASTGNTSNLLANLSNEILLTEIASNKGSTSTIQNHANIGSSNLYSDIEKVPANQIQNLSEDERNRSNSDRLLNTIIEEEENVSLLPLQNKTITTLVTTEKSSTPLNSPESSIPSRRTTQLFNFSSADPPNEGHSNSSFLNSTLLERNTTSSTSFFAKDSMSASHNPLSNITNDTTKISVRRKFRDNVFNNVNTTINQTQDDSMLNVKFSPQELCHSTPNRRSTRIQNATESQNESSMQSTQSSISTNGRPKRKAAPTNLVEPTLNKKLRNRTNKRL